MPTSRGEVSVKRFGNVKEQRTPLPDDWPNGQKLTQIMGLEGDGDSNYWQVCARWALLRKYGLIAVSGTHVHQDDGTRKLVFEPDAINEIQTTWREQHKSLKEGELGEFFQTSFSNQRPLEWALMDCGSGTQFRLHAHPNMELVYCVRGELHEVRMNGDPVSVPKNESPSLQDSTRSWSFATLRQGCWLVNEVGSVHKSFTSTSGQGCLLMVLWGGSHADIAQGDEPKSVDVHGAVNRMDSKLCECNDGKGQEIQETFLPESEKALQLA